MPLIPYFERPIFDIPLPAGLPWDSVPLHGFGLLVAIGFLLGGRHAIKRANRIGLSGDAVNRLIGWLVVGTFIGGHVGYGLFYEPQQYFEKPGLFLEVWHGLSSYGGFIVCVPVAIYFFLRNRMPLWPNLDCLAFGFSLGWFWGRMGCTVAHDHPGTASTSLLAIYCRPVEGHTLTLPRWMAEANPPGGDLRWGPCADAGGGALDVVSSITDYVPIDFAGGPIACHDTGFYEALFSLGLWVLFLVLDRKAFVPGLYTLLVGALYAPFRFWLDGLRPQTTDPYVFASVLPSGLHFTPAQWLSAGLFVLCVTALVFRFRSGQAPLWAAPGTKPSEEDGFTAAQQRDFDIRAMRGLSVFGTVMTVVGALVGIAGLAQVYWTYDAAVPVRWMGGVIAGVVIGALLVWFSVYTVLKARADQARFEGDRQESMVRLGRFRTFLAVLMGGAPATAVAVVALVVWAYELESFGFGSEYGRYVVLGVLAAGAVAAAFAFWVRGRVNEDMATIASGGPLVPAGEEDGEE